MEGAGLTLKLLLKPSPSSCWLAHHHPQQSHHQHLPAQLTHNKVVALGAPLHVVDGAFLQHRHRWRVQQPAAQLWMARGSSNDRRQHAAAAT